VVGEDVEGTEGSKVRISVALEGKDIVADLPGDSFSFASRPSYGIAFKADQVTAQLVAGIVEQVTALRVAGNTEQVTAQRVAGIAEQVTAERAPSTNY